MWTCQLLYSHIAVCGMGKVWFLMLREWFEAVYMFLVVSRRGVPCVWSNSLVFHRRYKEIMRLLTTIHKSPYERIHLPAHLRSMLSKLTFLFNDDNPYKTKITGSINNIALTLTA